MLVALEEPDPELPEVSTVVVVPVEVTVTKVPVVVLQIFVIRLVRN